MPLSRRLLQPLLSRALIHPRLRSLLQARYEWLRRMSRRPHQVVVWLRLNDPYSYLLIQMLPRFLDHFAVQPLFRLLPFHEPGHTYSHLLRDAWYLSQFHQLHFHEFQSPGEDSCFLASRLLLANRHLPAADFLVLARQVFGCLWEHQPHKLSLLAQRFPLLAASTTARKMALAEQRFLDQGQDRPAQLQHQGDWYWCLDDLDALGERLTGMGLNRLGHQFRLNGDGDSREGDFLLTDWEQLAAIRARKYALDYFFSFSDPLSYLYLAPVIALAEHYQLRLRLKPVLPAPIEEGGAGAPWYRHLGRAARLAERHGQAFGEVCLPSAQGLRACLALFDHACQQREEQTLTQALLRGIWAEGRDVSHRPHLSRLIADSGARVDALKKLLKSNNWQSRIDAYTVEWSGLETTDLPGFFLQGERRIAFCGANRLWAVEMAIIDNMKLIGHV